LGYGKLDRKDINRGVDEDGNETLSTLERCLDSNGDGKISLEDFQEIFEILNQKE